MRVSLFLILQGLFLVNVGAVVVFNPRAICASRANGNCFRYKMCCAQQCRGEYDGHCHAYTSFMSHNCECIMTDDFDPGDYSPDDDSTLPPPRPTRPTRPPTSGGASHSRSCGRRRPYGYRVSFLGGSGSNQSADNTPNRGESEETTNFAYTLPNSGEVQRSEGTSGVSEIQQNIVGGNTAQAHGWPWQASLRVRGEHNCGGTVIDTRHVLTAAHCITVRDRPRYTVALGIHRIDVMAPASQVYSIDKIMIHPKYKDGLYAVNYDAAILRLNRPITFSNTIAPACIAQTAPPAGTKCYVTGWGQTERSRTGGPSSSLQELSIYVQSTQTCKRFWPIAFDDTKLCAGKQGKDSCGGDSGGPFVCPMFDGRYEVHGIVSFGSVNGCGVDRPGVYTRVSAIRNWITSVTGRLAAIDRNREYENSPNHYRNPDIEANPITPTEDNDNEYDTMHNENFEF